MIRILTLLWLLGMPQLASAETVINWTSESTSCQFQYTIVDGVASEDTVWCSMTDTYSDRAQHASTKHLYGHRVYDLRLETVCTVMNHRGNPFGGACRTLDELRAIDTPFAQELVRRFEWLQARMRTQELNLRPDFDAFLAAAGEYEDDS